MNPTTLLTKSHKFENHRLRPRSGTEPTGADAARDALVQTLKRRYEAKTGLYIYAERPAQAERMNIAEWWGNPDPTHVFQCSVAGALALSIVGIRGTHSVQEAYGMSAICVAQEVVPQEAVADMENIFEWTKGKSVPYDDREDDEDDEGRDISSDYNYDPREWFNCWTDPHERLVALLYNYAYWGEFKHCRVPTVLPKISDDVRADIFGILWPEANNDKKRLLWSDCGL